MRRLRGAAPAIALALAACASAAPPDRGYADFLIARVANMRADHEIAADRYFAALARSPGDDALVRGALSATLAAGDVARARLAAHMAPDSAAPAYAHLVRAADAIAAQNWRRADNQLEHVEGAAAEEMIAHLLLAWTRTGQGRLDSVLVDPRALAAAHIGGLLAYQQAMALDYSGRDEEALAAYAAAAASDVWLPAAIERHADLLARRGAQSEAAAVLHAAVNRNEPALRLARQRLEAGAAPATQRLTPARGAAVGLYGLAAIFLREHDSANGLSALSLALMLDPQFDAARIAMAEQHMRLGQRALGLHALEAVGPDSPYATAARMREAWSMLDAGETDAALAHARAAAGDDALGLMALADMHRSAGRHQDAEPIYSRLIETMPGEWRLHFARGVARERQGRWSEAEADFRRALELAPEQPDVLNYLGYSWVDRGERLQEALAMIDRAVVQRPESGAFVDSQGWAHYRLGNYARAVELLERAAALAPGRAEINDHLGDVYWRLGRRVEARFQWRRALAQEPSEAIEAKIRDGLPLEAPVRPPGR